VDLLRIGYEKIPPSTSVIFWGDYLARLFRKPQCAFSPGLLERLMLKGAKTFSWRQL